VGSALDIKACFVCFHLGVAELVEQLFLLFVLAPFS
jgi:hypothetical protein